VEAAGVELFRVLTTRNLLIPGTATTAKKAPLPDPLYVYCTVNWLQEEKTPSTAFSPLSCQQQFDIRPPMGQGRRSACVTCSPVRFLRPGKPSAREARTSTVEEITEASYRLPTSAEWRLSLRQSRRERDRQNKPVWAEHLATVFLADIPRCSPIRPLSDSVLRASETMLDSYPNTASLVHQECARGQRSKAQQNPWAAPAPRSQKPVRSGY
jgi:hypothetical protein